jgi:hypothetical protein
MTPDPMIPDPFDQQMHALFAGVHPAADFEDRLVGAIRRRYRFAIPAPVTRAAIAAAAVLMVGTAGYYGNLAITGNLRSSSALANRTKVASSLHQLGLAVPLYQDKSEQWDFAGGSDGSQNWKDWNGTNGISKNLSYSYQNPFTSNTAIANGWQQKNPDAAYAISSDINPASAASFADRVKDNFDGRSFPATTDRGVQKSDKDQSRDGEVVTTTLPPAPPTQTPKASPYENLDSDLLPIAVGNDPRKTREKDLKALSLGDAKKVVEAGDLRGHVVGDNPKQVASTFFKPGGSEDGHQQAGKNAMFGPVADGLVVSRQNDFKPNAGHHEKVISSLIQDARNYTDEGKYTEALGVIDNIKNLDPNNAYANGVSEFVQDRAHNQEKRQYQESFGNEFNKQLNQGQGYFHGNSNGNLTPDGSGKTLNDGLASADPNGFAIPQRTEVLEKAASGPLPAVAAAPGNNGQAAPAAPAPVQPPAPAVDDRKIIRTGSMEFDVDRFDTAQMQITKIVGELGGFVGATDSTKLPNGKVRGSISVRVPPERLDTLVLSLRALGDLKSQQINAADITKEYTDIQSELTADRAMQDRLLELIHDGKGSVKDLLAAENELGEWRTKIEKAEGMIRYYNGQVALSTLTITMTERDIQTPATAIETETADVGIEADDVERARNSAMKAIDEAKGRIVEAELKRFDAGQLAAKLVADVPPESAGAVIDQLKLLGKVARLEVHRQQQSSDGSGGSGATVTNTTPLRTERKPTRLLISIYNLANVAPRRTTVVSLAAKDVETAYAALMTAAKSNGGRVVTSNLDRGDPVKATGSLVLELPPEKFDAAITTLHAQGDVLNLSLTENPDTQNSTEAKQGLTVKLISLANVAPRRTTNTSLAANDVDAAYTAIIATVKSNGGRVVTSTLDRGDPVKATGTLILEIPPDKLSTALATLHAQGDVLNINQAENPDTQNSTESKAGLTVKLFSMAAVGARESVEQTIAAADVPSSYQAILSAAAVTHSRVATAALKEQDRQNITADIELDVPRAAASEMDKAITAAGGTISRTATRAADNDNTVDSKVHLKLSISSADHLPAREKTALQMEVTDADKSAASAQAAAITAGGRVLKSTVFKDQGKDTAAVLLDFPLDKYPDLLQQIRSQGTVRGIDASRDPQAPTGPMAHAQIYVEFRTADAIVADQTGPWASVRQGLSTSINGLLWSLRWVVVGLCLIGPWAAILWIGWKVRNRMRGRRETQS